MKQQITADDIVRAKTPTLRALDSSTTFSIAWSVASLGFIFLTGIWLDFILQTLLFSLGYLAVFFFLGHQAEQHSDKNPDKRYLDEAKKIIFRTWILFLVISTFTILFGAAICGTTTNFIEYNIPVDRPWFYTYLKWEAIFKSLLILAPVYFYVRFAGLCSENKPYNDVLRKPFSEIYKKIYYYGRTPLQAFIFAIIGGGGILFSLGSHSVGTDGEPTINKEPNQAIHINSLMVQNNEHDSVKYTLFYQTTNPACSTHISPAGKYVPFETFARDFQTPVLATAENEIDGKILSNVYKDSYNPGFCRWKLSGIDYTIQNNQGKTTAKGGYRFYGYEPCPEGTAIATSDRGLYCRMFENSEYSIENYPSTTLPDPVFTFNLYKEPPPVKQASEIEVTDSDGAPVAANNAVQEVNTEGQEKTTATEAPSRFGSMD